MLRPVRPLERIFLSFYQLFHQSVEKFGHCGPGLAPAHLRDLGLAPGTAQGDGGAHGAVHRPGVHAEEPGHLGVEPLGGHVQVGVVGLNEAHTVHQTVVPLIVSHQA